MQVCKKTGKLQYEDRESARLAAGAIRGRERAKARQRLQAFRCPDCEMFHVGRGRGAPWERR